VAGKSSVNANQGPGDVGRSGTQNKCGNLAELAGLPITAHRYRALLAGSCVVTECGINFSYSIRGYATG
jgi:hypothetical protein